MLLTLVLRLRRGQNQQRYRNSPHAGGAGAALHAATSSTGSIRSDFEILTHGQLSRSRIDGTIGSGGPRIDLTTSNGNIRLLRI